MKSLFFVGAVVTSLLVFAFSAEAADKKTERTWNSKCASCHGKDGKGQTQKGQKMKIRDMGSAAFQKGSDADFRKAILSGVKKNENGGEMDGFEEELKPAEVDALISYIREFAK